MIEDAFEPIVDKELWNKVQEVNASCSHGKITKSGVILPLTGLMYCADCGSKLKNNTTFHETKKRGKYKETVRKIRKLGVENAAEILSTRDKSAALVLICCFNMKEGHYKRKRPASGLYHCHNSVYSD